MRRPSALLAAALVAGGLAIAAPAANAATTITLTGSSSGYATVTFSATTTLSASTATYSGGSTYVGFYIGVEPYPAGSYLLGMKHSNIGTTVNPGFGNATFAPGTYKLFLLTDGSATVTIPVSTGLSSPLSVTASNAVSDQSGSWSTPRSFSDPLWTGAGSRTVAINGNEVLWTVGKFTYPSRVPAQYTETGVCIEKSGNACSSSGQTTVGPNFNANPKVVTMQLIDDGSRFGAGNIDFKSHYLGLDDATSIETFSLVIPGVA